MGGHCIPIDPNYLSYKVRTLGYPFRFVELAQEINSRMPGYIVTRAAELLNRHQRPLNGSRVLLLGVTYKKDSADLRESPAIPVARRLRAAGAQLSFADPHAASWVVDGEPIPSARMESTEIMTADLVIVLQRHSSYDMDEIERSSRLLLDTTGVSVQGERL